MRIPMTVHDRAKKTGMVAGPDHPMIRGMKFEEEEEKMDNEPPNLRPSSASGEEGRCSYCDHFDDGQCTKYSYPVQAHQVCDAFEEGGVGSMGESPEMQQDY